MTKRRTTIAILGAFIVAACATQEPRLEGERISVLSFEQNIAPDPRVQDTPVIVPPSFRNREWNNIGGFPSHALYHLALDGLDPSFRVSMVSGNTNNRRLKAPPVMGDGKVFALGTQLDITAVDSTTGERIWRRSLLTRDEDADSVFGGGLAYADDRIFASTGAGDLAAFNAQTGEEIWRIKNEVPFSNAPTVRGGRLYIVARDNRLYAYSAADGTFLWEYSGIAESASVMTASSPAVSDQIVVVGFSSGEVIGLRSLNGTRIWDDTLSGSARQITPFSELSAIVGSPVIDRDRAFSVSHGGRMVATDLRSGERLWSTDISSAETPWTMGDYVLVVTLDGTLTCLSREQGRVRWVTELANVVNNPEEQRFWLGPLVAGEQVIVVSSLGELLAFSPFDGSPVRRFELGERVSVPPIIANGTLYILTDNGNLIARR